MVCRAGEQRARDVECRERRHPLGDAACVCQSRATVVRVSVCLPGMSVKMTTSNVVSEKMMSFISWR